MPPDVNDAALAMDVEPKALKRRSVHGVAVSLLGQVTRVFLQFGSQVYMAHLISPSDFGLIAMIAPVLRFVQMFNTMGLCEAVIQRPSISQRELSGLFWVNVAGSILLAVAFVAAAPLVVWMYGEPRLPEVMAYLSVILLLSGLSGQPMALLNRQMRFLPLTLIDVVSTASSAVVGIGMASFGFGYWALVGLQAANSITLCILAWLLCSWRPSWPRWEPGIVPVLSFGGHIAATSVLGFFAESLDKVLLGVAWGSLALGFYDRSTTLVMMTLVVIMLTFGRVAVPLLSRLRDAAARYRHTYIRMLQTGLLITTPGLLCVIVVPECVVRTLLGPDWMQAAPIIRLIAVGAVIYPVTWSATWLFVSQGRAYQRLVANSAGYAAIAASFLAGLPWGPVGVAGSWAACSWLVQAPLIVWAATRKGPVSRRDVGTACIPLAAGAVAASLLLWLVTSHLKVDSFWRLVLTILASYGANCVVLALLPDGRQFLRDTWALRSTLGKPSP